MQRHHLLPRQLLGRRGLRAFFDLLTPCRLGFDDFRRNGLLLPCSERAVRLWRLPLHRGPHHAYNAMVEERVGQIEGVWQRERLRSPASADADVLMRIEYLQRALRRRLLDSARRPVMLNTRDPLGAGLDFGELDAMAETLWRASCPSSD